MMNVPGRGHALLLVADYQSWRFLVVINEEDLKKIHETLPDANYWVKKAPMVVVGYPGDETFLNEKHQQLEHGPRIRKPESEVICYNAWEFSESD